MVLISMAMGLTLSYEEALRAASERNATVLGGEQDRLAAEGALLAAIHMPAQGEVNGARTLDRRLAGAAPPHHLPHGAGFIAQPQPLMPPVAATTSRRPANRRKRHFIGHLVGEKRS